MKISRKEWNSMYIMLVVRPRRKKKSHAFRRTDFWSYIHSGFVLRTKRLKKTVIFNFIQRSSHQLERVNSHFVSFRNAHFPAPAVVRVYTTSKGFAAAMGISGARLRFLRASPHKEAPAAPEEWLIPHLWQETPKMNPEQLVREGRKMSRRTGLFRGPGHQGQGSTGRDGTGRSEHEQGAREAPSPVGWPPWFLNWPNAHQVVSVMTVRRLWFRATFLSYMFPTVYLKNKQTQNTDHVLFL